MDLGRSRQTARAPGLNHWIELQDPVIQVIRVLALTMPLPLSLVLLGAPCGLRGCKNRPALFPGRMSYKTTKPGLVLFYILACFNCIVAY